MGGSIKLTKSETMEIDLNRKYLVVWGKSGTDIVCVLEIGVFIRKLGLLDDRGKNLVEQCSQHYFELGHRVETTDIPPVQYRVQYSPDSPVFPSTPQNPLPPPYYVPSFPMSPTPPPWSSPPIWAEEKPWGTGLGGTLAFIEDSKGSSQVGR